MSTLPGAPSKEEWESYRLEIVEMYLNEDPKARKTNSQICQILVSKYGRDIKTKSLEYRLGTWGIRKNMNKAGYEVACEKLLKQKHPETEVSNTAVIYNGMLQESKKLKKGFNRHGVNFPPHSRSLNSNENNVALKNIPSGASRHLRAVFKAMFTNSPSFQLSETIITALKSYKTPPSHDVPNDSESSLDYIFIDPNRKEDAALDVAKLLNQHSDPLKSSSNNPSRTGRPLAYETSNPNTESSWVMMLTGDKWRLSSPATSEFLNCAIRHVNYLLNNLLIYDTRWQEIRSSMDIRALWVVLEAIFSLDTLSSNQLAESVSRIAIASDDHELLKLILDYPIPTLSWLLNLILEAGDCKSLLLAIDRVSIENHKDCLNHFFTTNLYGRYKMQKFRTLIERVDGIQNLRCDKNFLILCSEGHLFYYSENAFACNEVEMGNLLLDHYIEHHGLPDKTRTSGICNLLFLDAITSRSTSQNHHILYNAIGDDSEEIFSKLPETCPDRIWKFVPHNFHHHRKPRLMKPHGQLFRREKSGFHRLWTAMSMKREEQFQAILEKGLEIENPFAIIGLHSPFNRNSHTQFQRFISQCSRLISPLVLKTSIKEHLDYLLIFGDLMTPDKHLKLKGYAYDIRGKHICDSLRLRHTAQYSYLDLLDALKYTPEIHRCWVFEQALNEIKVDPSTLGAHYTIEKEASNTEETRTCIPSPVVLFLSSVLQANIDLCAYLCPELVHVILDGFIFGLEGDKNICRDVIVSIMRSERIDFNAASEKDLCNAIKTLLKRYPAPLILFSTKRYANSSDRFDPPGLRENRLMKEIATGEEDGGYNVNYSKGLLYFLELGMSFSASASPGSLIHIVCQWDYPLSIIKEVLRRSKNAAIDQCSEFGTPLCIAIKKRNNALARLLLELKASPDAGCNRSCQHVSWGRRYRPIHEAIIAGNLDVFTWLIQKGCELNIRGDWFDIPIVFAAGLGRLEFVSFLLQQRLDIESMDKAIERATNRGYLAIADQIRNSLSRVIL